MTDNPKAKALLDRYLNGECTPGEKTLLESWYHNIGSGDEAYNPSWAEASKAQFLRQHYPGKRKQLLFTALKWAAAAAILVVLARTAFFFSGRPDLHRESATTMYSAVTGPGGLKRVQLPDSTIVWLNANSRLEWTSDFSGDKRRVSLSGEASFDVRHDATHPFVVHTADADIKVLGTCFNVETGTRQSPTQVALLRGKVAITVTGKAAPGLILQPGEIAACSAAGRMLRKYKADVSSYFSWNSGGFYAADMPLQQVVEKLCVRYGYTVTWHNRRGGHKHISVSFPRQAFKDMLESLCYLNHLQYTIDNHSVHIR